MLSGLSVSGLSSLPSLPHLSQLVSSIQNLPLAAHAVPLAALIAGLVLWFKGGSVLKGMMALLGLALGAGLGFLLLPAAGFDTVAGMPGHLVGLVAGGVIGLVVALAAFRVAMGFAAAMTLAVAAFLGVMVYFSSIGVSISGPAASSLQESADRAGKTLTERLRSIFGNEGVGAPATKRGGTHAPALEVKRLGETSNEKADPTLVDQVRDAFANATVADDVRAFLDELGYDIASRWSRLDNKQRLLLAGAPLLGWLLGMSLGVISPKRTAAIATAFFGAAVWLGAAFILLRAGGVEIPAFIRGQPLVWVVGWLVVSFSGVVIQLGRAKKDQVRTEPPRAAAA
ncbi:MAG: hypothetical protein SFZ23_06010 [Planctomycetota bacterium]|nr:hypothetical protein [Planctomycetota bacterium]